LVSTIAVRATEWLAHPASFAAGIRVALMLFSSTVPEAAANPEFGTFNVN